MEEFLQFVWTSKFHAYVWLTSIKGLVTSKPLGSASWAKVERSFIHAYMVYDGLRKSDSVERSLKQMELGFFGGFIFSVKVSSRRPQTSGFFPAKRQVGKRHGKEMNTSLMSWLKAWSIFNYISKLLWSVFCGVVLFVKGWRDFRMSFEGF